jgi:hypothetical protein
MAGMHKTEHRSLIVVESVRPPEEAIHRPIAGFGEGEIPNIYVNRNILVWKTIIAERLDNNFSLIRTRLNPIRIKHNMNSERIARGYGYDITGHTNKRLGIELSVMVNKRLGVNFKAVVGKIDIPLINSIRNKP